jgi:magnesium transporter
MSVPNGKRSRKAGMSPGSVVHIGKKRQDRAAITIVNYDAERIEEKRAASVEECFPYRDAPGVTWINIDGLHDTELIERLGSHFRLHPLILEDIVNTAERPKVEDYGEYIFFVLKLFARDGVDHGENLRQVSLVLGPNYVLSFQEKETREFDPAAGRLRRGKGRMRTLGPDYLAYSLIDAVVDSYFGILEKLGEEIDGLEEELVLDPKREVLQRIHVLKREMIYFRKSIWPLREIINCLERLETPLVKSTTDVFLRDLYDHSIQIIESVETYRDILSGMLETYLSSVSNRLNEVMKVLTIIATIFIPITFVVGVYGMNFHFMPEIGWKWGYPMVWVIILAMVGVMVAYFRRKKWL